jgi:UDP-glucose:(heptosyl)LPS alpha-1,3-glucosyltransferase
VKIALVILHADAGRGGAERYTIDLADALARRGHDVSLLASSFAAEMSNVRAVELKSAGATRVRKYERFLASLDEHLASETYDVVHAMLPVRRCDVYHPHAGLAVEAIESGHLKHGNSLKRGLARVANQLNARRQRFAAVERELLEGRRPPVVLCLSEYVKRTVVQHYPKLAADRLATLFNAVDLQRFDPAREANAGVALRERLGISQSRTVVLMIAQDYARKGLRQAIEALAAVNDPWIVLVVVGKEEPGGYRELAKKLGVNERVIFAGTTTDTYPFYRAADFFVLPTRHDPCSLVVLEALAMGVPVISTIFNGACEIMTEGLHGFVLRDPADVNALAEAMRRLSGAGFRDGVSRACLELRPKLSMEVHLDQLQSIYRELGRRRS